MNAGDCFWGDPNGGNNDHLWVVLNNPADHGGDAVLLNFTTDRDGKAKYTVPGGYHDGLPDQSVICYGDMVVLDNAFIEGEIACGTYKPNPPFPPAKLLFLVNQARVITFIPREIKALF